MAGLQPMVLRSVLPEGEGSLICFFAPIRIQESVAARTSLVEDPGLEYSKSPGSDTKVLVRLSDEHAHSLLAANILAKAERSPIFMVDHGADGKVPKILWPADLVIARMVAGSMGMIVRVPADTDLLNALQRLGAGPYDIMVAMAKLVNGIYHHWPLVDLALRPGINSGMDDPLISKT